MRQAYPEYRRRGITKEKLLQKLNTKDKEIFYSFLKTLSCGENKLNDIRASILQFQDIIQKPFDEIDLQDLREYNAILSKSGRKAYTLNGTKTHIKAFLRWHFRDWPERFDGLKCLKQDGHPFNEKKINEKTLLTASEVEKVVKEEQNYMKKTFFITLYESGTRPIELRFLKWDDIKFNVDGEISELSIYSEKTKTHRTVFIKDATHYLRELQKEKKGTFVFHSRIGQDEPIKKVQCFNWVRDMGKKHLGRDIFPYLIRHSRANELYKQMPSKISQKFLGHGKDMSDIYSHLSSSDVKEAMAKTFYNLNELPETPSMTAKMAIFEKLFFNSERVDFETLQKTFPNVNIKNLIANTKNRGLKAY